MLKKIIICQLCLTRRKTAEISKNTAFQFLIAGAIFAPIKLLWEIVHTFTDKVQSSTNLQQARGRILRKLWDQCRTPDNPYRSQKVRFLLIFVQISYLAYGCILPYRCYGGQPDCICENVSKILVVRIRKITIILFMCPHYLWRRSESKGLRFNARNSYMCCQYSFFLKLTWLSSLSSANENWETSIRLSEVTWKSRHLEKSVSPGRAYAHLERRR